MHTPNLDQQLSERKRQYNSKPNDKPNGTTFGSSWADLPNYWIQQSTTNNSMKPRREPLENPTQDTTTRVLTRETFSIFSYIPQLMISNRKIYALL